MLVVERDTPLSAKRERGGESMRFMLSFRVPTDKANAAIKDGSSLKPCSP